MSILTEVKRRAKMGGDKLKKSKIVDVVSDAMSYTSRLDSNLKGKYASEKVKDIKAMRAMKKEGVPANMMKEMISKFRK